MCSESEAEDRHHHLELSPFEYHCVSLGRQSSCISTTSSGGNGAANKSLQTPQRRGVKDANEISLDSPTPKKPSSLAAALSSPPSRSSSYYSKHGSNSNENNEIAGKSSYVPPFKRVADTTIIVHTEQPKPTQATIITSPTAPTIASTHKAARNRPNFHPQYVVKKYRRSAAGGGTLSEISEKSIRSLEQLKVTVEYLLLQILVWQRPPGENDCGDGRGGRGNLDQNEVSIWDEDTPIKQPNTQQSQQQPRFSLSDTVAFIDDRLRAVQKDLVTLLGNFEVSFDISVNANAALETQQQHNQQQSSLQHEIKPMLRQMQARMVRYSILALYLLSNVPPSKYEVKFGARALRTSLTCYLNLSLTLHEEYGQHDDTYDDECRVKDEMMAYMALLHSSAVLRSEESALPPSGGSEITSSLMEESGSGWGALLSTFTKHVLLEKSMEGINSGQSLVEKYPRWKWTLELASMVQDGNYQRYFNLLERGPSLSTNQQYAVSEDNARFLILARCCCSHSLNLIRLSALRRYNHTYGKGEKVSGTDIARLLRWESDDEAESSQLAISFCRDAGLPIIESDGENYVKVVMKSAPLSIEGDEAIGRMCNPGRSNDMFVFGTQFETPVTNEHGSDVTTLMNQIEKLDIEENVEVWEDRDATVDDASSAATFSIEARVDEDGVVIPASNVIWSLIQ